MADAQHPDIAAVVERLRRRASRIRAIGFVNDESASDADLAADNLEALARPVEDEEVRATAAFLAESGNERVRESASLLASLAREKASAEQERDEALAHVERYRAMYDNDATMPVCPPIVDRDYRNRIKTLERERSRAEQEIARLRESLTETLEYLSLLIGEVGDPGTGALCAAENARRALAPAAGVEEPRSAVPGAPSPRWRQISPETEAGLKALDEATRLGPHRARKMPPTGEEEPR